MSLAPDTFAAVQQSRTPGITVGSDATQFSTVPVQSGLAPDMQSDSFPMSSGGDDVPLGTSNFSDGFGDILECHPPSSSFTFRYHKSSEGGYGPSGTLPSLSATPPSLNPTMLMLEKIMHDHLDSMEALALDMQRLIMAVQLFDKNRGRLTASECEAFAAGMKTIPPHIPAQFDGVAYLIDPQSSTGVEVYGNGSSRMLDAADAVDIKDGLVDEEHTPSGPYSLADFPATLQELEATALLRSIPERWLEASDYSLMSISDGYAFDFKALPASMASNTNPNFGGLGLQDSLSGNSNASIHNDDVSHAIIGTDTPLFSNVNSSFPTTVLTQVHPQAGPSVARESSITSDSGYVSGSSVSTANAVSASRKRKRNHSKKSGMTVEVNNDEAPPPKRTRGCLEIISCFCKLPDGSRCPEKIIANDRVSHWRDAHCTVTPDTAHLHRRLRRYVCNWPRCGRRLKRDNVRNHFGRGHYKLTETQCPHCGGDLSQTSALNKHLEVCPERPRAASVTGTHS